MEKIGIQPKIVVVGSFMMDLVVRTPRLPNDGETIIGNSFRRFPGGKGANQAVAAAGLGANVTMVGKLGNDEFGQEMLATLQTENVETKNVLFDNQALTGVGSVTVDSTGNNRIVVVPGANLHFIPEELRGVEDTISVSDMLILQLEMDVSVVEEASCIASRNNVPVLLNPAPAQPLNMEILKRGTYLTPNETEAELLTGIKVVDGSSAAEAAKYLLTKGVKNVVITLGKHGALIAERGNIEYIEGFSVSPVDTVAAGDSFNGAFAVAITEGKPTIEAVKFANAAGALTVTKKGAIPSLPYRSDVERFLAAQQGFLYRAKS